MREGVAGAVGPAKRATKAHFPLVQQKVQNKGVVSGKKGGARDKVLHVRQEINGSVDRKFLVYGYYGNGDSVRLLR